MAKIVDARGLPCPQPVILTRKALKDGDEVTTIVDNKTAQHNVSRMAQKAGYDVQTEQLDDGTYLHIGGKGIAAAVDETKVSPTVPLTGGPLVLVVSSEFMGRGEHEELGNILIRGFFHTLGEVAPTPNTIIFFNSGVKLTVNGSPVVEDLQALAERGIEILACGTCLGHYEIADQLAVGEVSNMYAIAEAMLGAAKVVHL
jgi:selenium metabolism protein YedF